VETPILTDNRIGDGGEVVSLTFRIHERVTVDLVLESVNKKQGIKLLTSGMKCFEIVVIQIESS
jgi:hypothetical protein